MLFGLTNAPELLMDLKNHMCKPYLYKFVNMIIEDTLIYLDLRKNLVNTRKTSWTSQEVKFVHKIFKCDFRFDSVKFFDNVIGGSRIYVGSAKIKTTRIQIVLTTPTEVRQFLDCHVIIKGLLMSFL